MSTSATEILGQLLTSGPRPPRQVNPKVPPSLEVICFKVIEKEKERRYQSAAALSDDLNSFLVGKLKAHPSA